VCGPGAQGRSATLVLCYLLAHHGWTLAEARAYLLARRPRISRDIFRRPIVHAFTRGVIEDDRPGPATAAAASHTSASS
jgi:hypothetical protein